MKNIIIITLLILLFLTACSTQQSTIVNIEADGINLAANYSLSYDEQKEAVILLHNLGGTKEHYLSLTPLLNEYGFTTLALDFRGHGESKGNQEDYPLYIEDIKAAKQFLEEKGYKKIHIIGASIGANSAVKYGTEDREIKKIITLSPGKNYKGYNLPDYLNNYYGELYIISAGEDTIFGEDLKNSFKGEKKYRPFPHIEYHGTQLLQQSDVPQKIIFFLRR